MHLPNSWLFYCSVVIALVSIFLKFREKDKAAIITLFLSAIFLRVFMAHLDPFLHEWDERFHALVARNFLDNPLLPKLRVNPIVPYDYKTWCCNYVWLHKQPLFLWQMAISMKIFGITEFAIRYPSVLLGSLMVLLTYRIGFLASRNKNVGYIAAILFCFSYYHLELLSGFFGMDHNDISFNFYVLASIWAYSEYINKRTLKWAIVIGIFAGFAILNKWLVGLLVYAPWGINILLSIKNRETRKQILQILLSIIVCAIIFMPWQIYIFQQFPIEARYEFEFNSKHLIEAVEGHQGTNAFYWDYFDIYFGQVQWIFIFPGIIGLFISSKSNKKLVSGLFVAFLFVFTFFSFIAPTKVYAYFMIVVPLGYIFMAYFIEKALQIRYIPKIFFPVALIIIAIEVLQFDKIQDARKADNQERETKIYHTKIFKNLKKVIPPNVLLVNNTRAFEDIDLMFYNPGVTAYHYCFGVEDFEYVRSKNLPIAVFTDRSGYPIPNHIKDYPRTFIIPEVLK
jgi:4-amino-4-deoxy-L-arabinose transferase-like glycosyltransferase